MSQYETLIHLIAGGTAGTVGAVITCPLEVVKTRLQSSSSGFYASAPNKSALITKLNADTKLSETQHAANAQRRNLCTSVLRNRPSEIFTWSAAQCQTGPSATRTPLPPRLSLVQCFRHIIENEGPRALFKGLIPNIIGVAPSRAIYFCTYSKSKAFFNTVLPADTPIVHISSACCAGFAASTATNPIWFVKTRLQLHNNKTQQISAMQCVKNIYKQSGIRGFYKGITASYMGVSETVVHFVIYEAVKQRILASRMSGAIDQQNDRDSRDFIEFMMAGAFSKTIASCIAYPHEVARTRLREEGNRYHSFWQTLHLVWQEEGIRGLYRGLGTQLIRQIPNTAIVMATYELVVYVLMKNRMENNQNEFFIDEKSPTVVVLTNERVTPNETIDDE